MHIYVTLIFLTFWGILFLLVLVCLCVVEASPPPPPSCSTTRAGLFVLLGILWWVPEVWGTLESRLRSIFTSRDLGGLQGSREPLAACPVFSECLWVAGHEVLWGIFWQMVSVLGMVQLILTAGAGNSWSGWAGWAVWEGLGVGQEQGLGYLTPQDGQWLCGTGVMSGRGSDSAFRLSSEVCLEVLLLSLLVSLLTLIFLQWPVFVFTLGLSVKHGSLSRVATTSSDFTMRAVSVWSEHAAFTGLEGCVLPESFLEVVQLLSSTEGAFWLLFG